MLSRKNIASLLLLLLPILAAFRGGREVAGIVAFYLAALFIIFLFLRQEKPFIYSTALDVPLLAFGTVIFFSAIHSFAIRMEGIMHAMNVLLFIALFYLMVRFRDEEGVQEKFFLTYLLLCAVLSAVVCFQGFLGWKQYVAKTTLPGAHFPNHNLMAGFLAPAITTTISYIIFSGRKRIKSHILPAILLTILITAQFFTFSRGAWVSIVAGTAYLGFHNFRRMLKPLIALCIIALIGFVFMPRQFLAKWATHKFSSEQGTGRSIIWRTGINALKERPLTGWGLGSFGSVFNRFKAPCEWETARYGRTTRFAHNEYLDCAVENGIIGLAIFLSLLAAGMIYGIKTTRSPDTSQKHWLKTASVSGAIAILTHSFFDFNLHLPVISFMLIFFASNIAPVKKKLPISPALTGFLRPAVMLAMTAVLVVSSSFIFEKLKLYAIATTLNPLNSGLWASRIANEPLPQKKETLYTKALAFRPEDNNLHVDYARLLAEQKKIPEALSAYKTALHLDPHNAFIYSEVGDIFYGGRDYDNAFKWYAGAVEQEPVYIYARFRLAEILFLEGKNEAAKNEIEAIKKIRSYKPPAGRGRAARLLDYSCGDFLEKLSLSLLSPPGRGPR